ncbi:MAG TPA: acetyl-CoA carboxylase carboxyltransferase subunit alpha [Chloroflexota bacterium]|nr:acetyl-CoA carboxylase carboxyltransferase subunit alpha [Chloroflexota bacterium]
MSAALDFERPLADLRKQLDQAEKHLAAHDSVEARQQRDQLAAEIEAQTAELYRFLSPWQKVQVARHGLRPQTLDYAKAIFTDFVEFHGDRLFGDDGAIVGGPARLDGVVVMLIGHQRGKGTKESVERNFGQPHPEGYRKALRLFRHAEKFGMPVITLLDTPAASPGLEDEERGQAWALAENIAAMSELRVPIVSAVIGQGGSGGALAIGVADRLLMLEHAIFSVAPPETAANILWKDPKLAPEAAAALKLTAGDLRDLGLVDRIVPEPPGGAHADPAAAAELLGAALREEFAAVVRTPIDRLVEQRYDRYRRVGAFVEA